jgi:hypothetical protein
MTLLDSLRSIVEQLTRDRIFLAQHSATVEMQHADDTLDVTPDDYALRAQGLSNVPIRHGIPGVRVRVKQGSRCLIGFEGGNPRAPYAALWDASTVDQLIFNGGTAGAARVGDMVQVYWPATADVVGGVLNGAPFAATLILASPAAGIITSGSPRALIGD